MRHVVRSGELFRWSRLQRRQRGARLMPRLLTPQSPEGLFTRLAWQPGPKLISKSMQHLNSQFAASCYLLALLHTDNLTWPLSFLHVYRIELPEWHFPLPTIGMDDNENVPSLPSLIISGGVDHGLVRLASAAAHEIWRSLSSKSIERDVLIGKQCSNRVDASSCSCRRA